MKKKITAMILSGLLLTACGTEGKKTAEINTEAFPETEAISGNEEQAATDTVDDEEASTAEENNEQTLDHQSLKPVIDRIYQYINERLEVNIENIFYMVSEEGPQMQFEFRENMPEDAEQTNLIGIFYYDSETGRLTTTDELGEEILIEEKLTLE